VVSSVLFFFFQAEDGIRDYKVTGVQTCALPIYLRHLEVALEVGHVADIRAAEGVDRLVVVSHGEDARRAPGDQLQPAVLQPVRIDRKSTRLNSSHLVISYAVFCLKKKKKP